jgi:hypothetical protein
VETIRAAVTTPEEIAKKALLKSNFNKEAITHPVQAPVVGIGIATNIKSPNRLYFFIVFAFLIDLLLTHPIVFEKR